MIAVLIIQLCTTPAMDDCQAHKYHEWESPHARYECLASIEPTLDALKRDGFKNVAAYCETTRS